MPFAALESRTVRPLAGLALAMGLLLTAQAEAAPLIADLGGTITNTSGDADPYLNTSVSAHFVYDLDEANALQKETFTDTSGLTITRWTFSGAGSQTVSPYNQTHISGDFGAFSVPQFLEVETIDNLDLDSVGNPFGMSGVVDVLSVWANTDTVDCSAGTIDPATGGCSDPDAPILEGVQYGVHFVGGTGWFDGIDVLPTAMLEMTELLAVFGELNTWQSGVQNAAAEITYTSLALSGDTGAAEGASVPLPMPAALMLAGLAAIRQRTRRA